KAIARRMSPTKLRAWLKDEKTPVARLRLYPYLLGICGRAEDGAIFRAVIDRLISGAHHHLLDGALIGYTLLDPKGGWAFLCDRMHNPAINYWCRNACLVAARDLALVHPGVVSDKDWLAEMRLVLRQPALADVTIRCLEELSCWKLTDEVLGLFDKKDF